MAALPRVYQKQFGVNGTSGYFGQFGSKAASAPTNTKDPATIQSLAAFTNGLQSAVLAGNIPCLEDMNSLFLLGFRQLAYLFEQGVAEYDATTEYNTGAYAKASGVLFVSIADANTGNAPASSPTKWTAFADLYGTPTGTVQAYAGSVAPTGWVICDGSAISRSTYAKLFALVGTTYGVGDGSTTFNVPDLRERTAVGYKSGSAEFGTLGRTYGAKTHTLSINEIPSHSHSLACDTNGTSLQNWRARATQNSEDVDIYTNATGGGLAHNNIQPSIALNFIIKV